MGGSSAPAQDPNMGRAALLSAQTGRDMLAWMRGQAQTTNRWAAEDRARYKTTFQPLQDQFIREAQDFASPARKQATANAAAADVALAASQQQGQTQRQMASMGINPASGRALTVMQRGGMDTALATAGARNLARRQVDDQGRQLRASAVNMGSGLAVNPGTSMGLSNSAGSSGFQGAIQGYGQQANILNQDYNNRYQAWQANQGMLGSLAGGLGTIAGAVNWGTILPMLSSKDAKTDKRPAMGLLDAVKAMPVEQWTYKEGQGDGGTHVGPYAEDFAAATGMGDGKTIDVISALGVTMGAVKELAAKVETLAAGPGTVKGAAGTKKPAAPRPAMGITEAMAA